MSLYQKSNNLLNYTKVMLDSDANQDPAGIDDLVINAVISADTSGRQLDSFVVTFDRPVDPSSGGDGRDLLIGGDGLEPSNGDGAVDAADYIVWRTNDAADANALTFDTQGRLLIGTESGIWNGDGHEVLFGGDGLDPSSGGCLNLLSSTYTFQPGGCDHVDLSLTDMDRGPLPVSQGEYGLMIMLI